MEECNRSEADIEEDDLAVEGVELLERCPRPARVGALLVPFDYAHGVPAQCQHRVGGMQAPARPGAPPEHLGDEPHHRERLSHVEGFSLRQVVVGGAAKRDRDHQQVASLADEAGKGVDDVERRAGEPAEGLEVRVDQQRIRFGDSHSPQLGHELFWPVTAQRADETELGLVEACLDRPLLTAADELVDRGPQHCRDLIDRVRRRR
jgi:hypothetical protein